MILSVHIPKTGGVSIRNILKEHYGPGFVLYYWQATDAWGRTLPEVPATAECVHGHFQTDQLTGRFPKAELITWVRDPVERVVSSYYHRLREPDWQHPVCQELHAKKLSVAEYAALPLVRNEMTHFFGSKRPEDFLFVGVMEQFEVSFTMMSKLLGLPVVPLRRDNMNPDKKKPHYELADSVRDEIRRLNQADTDLYAHCQGFWRNMLSRPGLLSGLIGAAALLARLASEAVDFTTVCG